MTFLEERDLGRMGRDAREWLLQDRALLARGREAREWLTHDERGRAVGWFLLSLAVSIAMTVIVTAIVGSMRRRGAVVEPVPPEADIAPDVEAAIVPVMAEEPATEEAATPAG
jgi:hypothetical protein